jgi:uncharacterized cupin superfamily protein
MSGVDRILSLQAPPGPPERDHPRPERRVAGDPERRTWNLYSSPDERCFAGVWESDPGAWRIEVPAGQDELCTLLEGRVRLRDDQGETREFGPGESFVLAGGFRGTWETVERLRKVYMIALRG